MKCTLRFPLIGGMFVLLVLGARAELVNRYSFTNGDIGAVDSVGGRHGTLMNGAVISNNAVQLSGSNQYVNLPSNLITNFHSVTFEAWFSHSSNGNWTRVFDFGTTSGSSGRNYFFFSPRSGYADSRFVITDGAAGDEEILSYSTLAYNSVLHIACVYDNDAHTMRYYLNGELKNSISVTNPLSSVNNVRSYLGRSLYSNDPYLRGSIDEFRIYDHALGSDEIAYNFTAGPDIVNFDRMATNPYPEKNAVSINPASPLGWTAPTLIPDRYTVYVGDNAELAGAQVIAVASGTSCVPELQSETTYYWRVDTHYGTTTYTGTVWSFTTCVSAIDRSPAGDLNHDYAVDIQDLLVLAELWLNDKDFVHFAEVAADWMEQEPALIINEFMADNNDAFADPDASEDEYDDWIEIYNRSSVPRDLGGMYLTDNLKRPKKWQIPEGVTAEAYGYVVFWADDQGEQGELHTNFKLSADGEEIGLFDSDGVTLIDSVVFGKQYRNMSYGRFPDNSSQWNLFADATPGRCNCQGYEGAIADVEFSADGGIYSGSSEAFDVSLACETAGAVIRYTTDFTEPTETSTEYTGPIHIDSTTCLRAAAFKTGWYCAKPVSRTYVFLDDVMSQSTAPAGFPTSWGSNVVDYQVDPDVVNDPAYSSTFKDDLKTIPSVCIVIPNDAFFGAASGIYANATQRGDAWERMASIEVINPVTDHYYQANAGLRAHGGVGRSPSVAKHSLRILFKSLYGPSKMEFPLFEDCEVESFDQLVLRATWNYSWVGDSTYCNGIGTASAQYMREMYGHDTIRDMGGLQGAGRHVHLYINGLYWGLYILVERPDESFASEHLGGSKSDYDVIKTDSQYTTGSSVIEVVSGDIEVWDQLYALAAGDLSGPENYAAIQDYVNIPALIDYMLMIYHVGSRDAPVYLCNDRAPRNFYAIRKRQEGEGFVFLPWDVEWSLENETWDRVNVSAYSSGYENPAYLMTRLRVNEEFCMQIADRIHEHYFNDGVLTEAKTIARYLQRSMDIDRAIIGESARWGDTLRATPYTRNAEWAAERNRLIHTYFPARDEIVLSQLRTAGFYPNTAAPVFHINGTYQHGGTVSSGAVFSITAPAGTVWYTVDGSDPRLTGGGVNTTSATAYTGPVIFSETTQVKARVLNGSSWSALNAATYICE